MLIPYFLSIASYYFSLLAPFSLPIYLVPWVKALPALVLYYQAVKRRQAHRIYSSGIQRVIHNLFLYAAIGDLFLGYDYLSMGFFVLGMFFFALTHIHLLHYLELINCKNGKPNKLFLNILFWISLSSIFLFSILSYLVFPIIVYTLIVSNIVAGTILNLKSSFHFGCLIFVVSDIIILLELIFGYWGIALPIYWISLAFIATSL